MKTKTVKKTKTVAAKASLLLKTRQPPLRELLAQDAVFYDAAGDFHAELRRASAAQRGAQHGGGDYSKTIAESRLRFVNSPRLLEIASYKPLALAELAARGVPVPRSIAILGGKRVAFGEPAAASRLQRFVAKTAAAKGVAVHRGEGIVALRSFREPAAGGNELVQEFVWPPVEFGGFVKDLRVLIVGNRVAARYARRAPKPLPQASERQPNEKQFLTNAARGGVVEEFPFKFKPHFAQKKL